jgi:hypothetical protein
VCGGVVGYGEEKRVRGREEESAASHSALRAAVIFTRMTDYCVPIDLE